MRVAIKRLVNLERQARGGDEPIVVFTYGGIPPVIPENPEQRDVLIWRTVIVEPPVRDKNDNIIAPAREWSDDDPRYQELYAARNSRKAS